MNTDNIVITDPNYRDKNQYDRISQHDREYSERKLAAAAIREEKLLNEPTMIERWIKAMKKLAQKFSDNKQPASAAIKHKRTTHHR